MKKALITGINGFVGPYLQKELEEHEYSVVGFGREKECNIIANYNSVDISKKDEVYAFVNEEKPTHIFHLAGISSPPYAEKNPKETHSVNVEGTRHLLDAAKDLDKKPEILIISSSRIYGEPQHLPIDEDHPINPKGVYSKSRKNQEDLVKGYMEDLPIIIARSFNHTGPGQTDDFVVAKIIKHIVEIKNNKRKYLEMGNGDIKRDISDVRDVVRAYRLLLEQPCFGMTLNICRGDSIALKEIVECAKISAKLSDIEVRVNPKFIRKDDVIDIYGSTKKLQKYIKWHPKYSYKQMIRDIFKYWDQLVN